MKLNFIWKENTGKYQSGESLFLNRIRVASYEWNGSRSRNDPHDNNNYVGRIILPQSRESVYDDDTDILRSKIENIVTAWFKEATK